MSIKSTTIALRQVLQGMRDTNTKLMGGLPAVDSFEQRQLVEQLGRWSRILASARRAERSAFARSDLLALAVPKGRHSPAKDRHRAAGNLAHELSHTVQQLGAQLAELDKRIRGMNSPQRELERQADAFDELLSQMNDRLESNAGQITSGQAKYTATTETTMREMYSAAPPNGAAGIALMEVVMFAAVWLSVLQTTLSKRK